MRICRHGSGACSRCTPPRLRDAPELRDDTGMSINNEDVLAFIDVYEAEYGVRLSIEEAWEMAERLVSLYETVARPLPDVEDLDAGHSI
jgi:hypothetical protein